VGARVEEEKEEKEPSAENSSSSTPEYVNFFFLLSKFSSNFSFSRNWMLSSSSPSSMGKKSERKRVKRGSK